MFALETTRQEMLARIRASGGNGARVLRDPADRRFVSLDEARLVVSGTTPDDLLPILNLALCQRFADVPAAHLMSDLLRPLKKAVGNAWKRGNRKDPDKHVTVEIVATPMGAVVTVSDEGAGFDVGEHFDRYRDGRCWYTHGGSGFSCFAGSRSLVSFADGGRTLLVGFLCVPESGRTPTDDDRARWGPAAEPDAVRALLAGSMPELAAGSASLEACRISVPDEQPADLPQISYRLECRDRASGRPCAFVLTGFLYSRAAAVVARGVTAALGSAEAADPDDVLIPEPVAALDEPPVVVYRFDPRLNLRQYLKQAHSPGLVAPTVAAVGRRLRALHDGRAAVPVVESPAQALRRWDAVAQGVTDALAGEKQGLRKRLRAFVAALEAGRADIGAFPSRPIHGDPGWKQILRSDDRLYLSGFGSARRSHPGFDAGGFLADLRRFCALGKHADRDLHRTARDAFLSAYGADDPPPWLGEAPIFEAFGLLTRAGRVAQRSPEKRGSKLEALLGEGLELLGADSRSAGR